MGEFESNEDGIRNYTRRPVAKSNPPTHLPHLGDTMGTEDIVQKKSKDRTRPFLAGSPLLLLITVAAAVGFWFINREPSVRELSYGSLMHICKADDPPAR